MIYLKSLQKKIATEVFGPGTLRSLPSGTKDLLKKYLRDIDLKAIPTTESEYSIWLNSETIKLEMACRMQTAQLETDYRMSWGHARKAMNIFMRDVLYSRYLHVELCKSNQIEAWLEIPVDSFVANGLRKKDSSLPKWKSLTKLGKDDHSMYQKFAQSYAKKENTKRVHLDLVFFVERSNVEASC